MIHNTGSTKLLNNTIRLKSVCILLASSSDCHTFEVSNIGGRTSDVIWYLNVLGILTSYPLKIIKICLLIIPYCFTCKTLKSVFKFPQLKWTTIALQAENVKHSNIWNLKLTFFSLMVFISLRRSSEQKKRKKLNVY